MTTYKTGNPLGSVSPKDLFDNSENLDHAVNGVALTWDDRFGKCRLSWAGIESRARIDIVAAAEQAALEATAQAAELRDQAQVARNDAREARDDAISAAAASGDFVFAETYADAQGKLPLPNGTIVEVGRDETLDGSRTRYVVESDQLRFAVNLDLVRIALAEPEGAEIVGFRRPESTAVRRNLLDRGNDTVSVLDFIDTPVDGETSNQDGIVDAVAAAERLGADLVWPPGTYVSTESIPGFWNVRHTGSGLIKRGDNIWHITPRGSQRNIIKVSQSGLPENDGISPSTSTNVAEAFNRIRNISDKASDGIWRIHLIGALNSDGVRLRDLPAFRNRLEIFGDDVSLTEVPATEWDGVTANAFYAVRGDWSDGCLGVFIHLKNIKFTNWNKSPTSGAVVIWADGQVLSENIHTENCAVGAWYRKCYVRHVYGTIANASTYGVSIQYGAQGNVGDLHGGGVKFQTCAEGVNIGRQATAYVQGSRFSGCASNITCSRNSRVRPQGNIHDNWIVSAYYLQMLGVLTPDNGAGSPDVFNMTPTDLTPVLRLESGSVHSLIQRFDGGVNSFNPSGSIATINSTVNEVLLSEAPGVAGGDFIAARIPAYWFYSVTAALDMTMYMNVPAGSGGRLELRGGPARVLASINIPAISNNRSGEIRIKLFRRPGTSTARFFATFQNPTATVVASGSSENINTSAIRSPSEGLILYRLYWVPENTGRVDFADMVTNIRA